LSPNKGGFLPYGRQSIDQDDINEVVNTLKSDYLTEGPIIDKFEIQFAKKVGVKYAVVCSSGTAGLHLSSLCLGLNSKYSALVPAISFVATANAPLYTGANIEFVDVDPSTGLISVNTLIKAINKSKKLIKVLFYVHLNGNIKDLSEIKKVCDNHNIMIVEDSCHAIGGSIGSDFIGSCNNSELSVFSFHPVKTITMGEGGVITTNSEEYRNKLKLLRSHGIVRDKDCFLKLTVNNEEIYGPWYYEMQELGFNYRANAINVALGLSQLKKLNDFVYRRSEIASIYDSEFEEFSNYFVPVYRDKSFKHGYHRYPILIKGDNPLIKKKQIIEHLKKNKIGTQVHYIPIPSQPFWMKYNENEVFPGSFEYFSRCLSLPIFPAMKQSDINNVIKYVKKAFEELK